MRHVSRIFTCLTLVVLTLAGTVAAQPPLADHVPGDALVYVGWRGVDKLGDQYDQSNLKAVLNASRFDVLMTQAVPDLIEQYAGRDQDAQLAAQFLQDIVPVLWHRPWAAYQRVLVPDQPEAGPPFRAQTTLIIDAGPDAATVTQWINKVIQAYQGPPAMKPQLIAHDGLVGVRVNIGIVPDPAAENADILAERDNFKAALKQVGDSTAFVVWADVSRLTKTIDQAASQARNPRQTWHRIRDALGLGQVKQAIYAAGLDGENWRTSAFVAMSDTGTQVPVPGLIPMLLKGNGKHLTDEALKLVPKDATWMSVSYFNPGALLDAMTTVAQIAFPKHPPSTEAMLDHVKAKTGVDVEHDLIGNLGNVWATYNDPDAAGPAGMGMVLVNPVTNADAVRSALDKLAAWGERTLNQDTHAPFPMFHFRTFTRDGLTVHTFSLLFLTPSWTVHDGKLYAALLPQAIVTAAGANTDTGTKVPVPEGGSILDNDRFQAVRDRLGDDHVDDATGVAFIDLPRTAPATYPGYVMLSQMVSGFMPGEDVPGMILPPLGVIMAHLSPAGQVAWTDDAGWHYRSVSPFPGSTILAQESPFTSMAAAPLFIGIMMPALGAARRTARQMHAATQARGIDHAAVMYSTKHNNQYPPDLAALLHGNYITIEYLIAPASGIQSPADFGQWPKAKQDAWIQQNASFVLIPGGTFDIDAQKVDLFQKPTTSDGQQIIVAFGDGHTQMMPIALAEQLIEAQTGKTIDQLVNLAEAGELTADKVEGNTGTQDTGTHGSPPGNHTPPPF